MSDEFAHPFTMTRRRGAVEELGFAPAETGRGQLGRRESDACPELSRPQALIWMRGYGTVLAVIGGNSRTGCFQGEGTR